MFNELKMFVLTDTHFVSKKLWVEGEAINNREKGDQIALKLSPEIIETFFDKIIEDTETENVLITGDLVNSGEKIGHEEFIELLNKLVAAGKKVYVTTATHDYNGQGRDENFFNAVYYDKNFTRKAEGVYKDELLPLYYNFGPSTASSVHESGSYSVEIQKGYRLIAINDNGNGRSHCGLFDDGFIWLENELVAANEKGETVLLAVHHPVVPPWDIYEKLVEFEMFGGYKKLRELMCKYGVKLIFTGHTHVHGIKKYENDVGQSFYDITTTALVAAKGKMRKVVVDKDRGTCDIESICIDSIKGVDLKGKSAYEYIYSLNFVGLLYSLLPLAGKDFNLFLEKASNILPVQKLYKKKKFVKFIAKGLVKLKIPAMLKFADKITNSKVRKSFAFIIKRVLKIKMSTLAKFAGKYCDINKKEKKRMKKVLAKEPLFRVLDTVFSGNPPFSENDTEFKIFYGVCLKADAILRAFGKDVSVFIKGMESCAQAAKPFLTNTRTGDDDTIHIRMDEKND